MIDLDKLHFSSSSLRSLRTLRFKMLNRAPSDGLLGELPASRGARGLLWLFRVVGGRRRGGLGLGEGCSRSLSHLIKKVRGTESGWSWCGFVRENINLAG
jgi:hypothetical protein